MAKFKKGDWVRATAGDEVVSIGDIGKVADGYSRVPYVDWIGKKRWAYIEKDMEPWLPRVGERVRFTDECPTVWFFGPTKKLKDGVVTSHFSDFSYQYKVDTGDGTGHVDLEHIEPITDAAPVAKLQIEAGKYYRTRDGRKVGPMAEANNDIWNREIKWTCGDRGWYADGNYYKDATSGSDLIAEWTDPPIAEASGDSGAPKFKVGDRVTIGSNQPYILEENERAGTIIGIASGRGDWDVNVDNYGGKLSFFTNELSLAPTTESHIVCRVDDGQPKPAVHPFVHATKQAAEYEADRLAKLHPGCEFAVFSKGTVAKVEKTYDHEWQRLAASGNKIAAIKELRAVAGLGLATAKGAVEDWLRREAA